MARFTHWLTFAASPLALVLILGGARATLSGIGKNKIKTEADHQFLHCSTALVLFQQNRDDEALALLKRHAHTPIPLTTDSSLSNELSPGSQVILLNRTLIHEAENAAQRGDKVRAHVYMEQCRALNRRILAIPQTESGLRIARAMEKLTERTEVTLLSH